MLDVLRGLVSAGVLVLRRLSGETYSLRHVAGQAGHILAIGAIAYGELAIKCVPLKAIVDVETRHQIMAHAVAVNINNVLGGDRETGAWRDRRADLEALEQDAAAVGCRVTHFLKTTRTFDNRDVDRLHEEVTVANY
jgi:hypothetical protein